MSDHQTGNPKKLYLWKAENVMQAELRVLVFVFIMHLFVSYAYVNLSLFLFLLVSGVGCSFCLWLFLDFSVYLFGPLLSNGVNHSDSPKKADILNDQFTSVFTEEDTSDVPKLNTQSVKSIMVKRKGVLSNSTTSTPTKPLDLMQF